MTAAAAAALLMPGRADAQRPAEPHPYATAVASWIAAPATPGYEQIVTDLALAAFPGWKRDDLGTLVRQAGSGAPHRVIACAGDQAGYVVSEIRDDGWLRVHGSGTARRHPLWDQFHEGQRAAVIVGTGNGASSARTVPGVFAVRSTHLWRRRPAQEAPTSVEDLWVDVGARSRGEVEKLGIRILDPVAREWPRWTYADRVAGPDAAGRAGCMALATAAQSPAPTRGTTTYVIAAQSAFNHAGLSGVLGRLGHVDTLLLLDGDRLRVAATGVSLRAAAAPWTSVAGPDVGVTLAASLPVRHPGTLAESAREADLVALAALVARVAGAPASDRPAALPALARADGPAFASAAVDSLARWSRLLATLADVYAVSGHEQPMRDALLAAMPEWARRQARTDSAGNLVLEMGPDRDTVAFVAHMDEIGLEVTRIAPDGTVSLRTRGGFFPSLWEGQPALLHRTSDRQTPRSPAGPCAAGQTTALRGVFAPRDSATTKQPAELTAWFGLDSAGLAAAGVKAGDAVTAYKCAARLSDVRFTARALDDRAGSTALVAALDGIDPKALRHKVIFAWSTREETGLEGARALAERWRGSVRRVYAVDTFVSSDSPLESARFADLPLGAGAIVRALDNSSATPPQETERVVRVARAARIPIQVGTTNGGNDGSAMLRHGVVDVPLSWPGRYSHSPAEVLDLRDVRALSRLVAALALAP